MVRPFQSLAYLKIFIASVLLLGVLSLFYKGFLQVKNSAFKYNTFNILFIKDAAVLMHLDSQNKKITKITISDGGKYLKGKTRLSASILLGIPVDGIIEGYTADLDAVSLMKILVNDKYRLNGLNRFDIVKIIFISKTIWHADVIEKKENLSNIDQIKHSEGYQVLFRDSTIFNEKATIEIVNASKIDGLGAKVSLMLENLGHNVVFVKSGVGKSMIITRTKEQGSVKRLVRLFEIPYSAKKDYPSLADVVIILGKDIKNKL